MQTVGQLLQTTRLQKELSLEVVEKLTKIRRRYLVALEKDDYRQLPSATVAKGFIKNYGRLLGLSNEMLQAIFRRDFTESQSGQVVPRGIVKPLNKPETFSWNPRRTAILLVLIISIALSGYFLYQLFILNSAPSLSLNQPSQNQTLSSHEVVVTGKTNPDVAVTVNGQLAQVADDGSFKTTVELPSGQTVLTIIATSKSQKTTKLVRDVLVQ